MRTDSRFEGVYRAKYSNNFNARIGIPHVNKERKSGFRFGLDVLVTFCYIMFMLMEQNLNTQHLNTEVTMPCKLNPILVARDTAVFLAMLGTLYIGVWSLAA